jgi:hypothetical protein
MLNDMKQFATFAFLMMMGTVAFGQKTTDPSVSANNYKHANKAAYAKKHKLDKTTELTPVSVADNSDYKHQARKAKMTKKAQIATGSGAASHKHPLGL